MLAFDLRCKRDGLTSWQFCEHALDKKHVALTPGKDFGTVGADRYVRLSYAASAESLAEAIRRLGVLMDRLVK